MPCHFIWIYLLLCTVVIIPYRGAYRISTEEEVDPLNKSYIQSLIRRSTGQCPAPHTNFQEKDNRLNFYGKPYVLPPDKNSKLHPCQESDCSSDAQCHYYRKCCKNACGGFVCTERYHNSHPCSLFYCPTGTVCTLQQAPCISLECPDVSQPVCVVENLNLKRTNIFDFPYGVPYGYIHPLRPFYRQPYGYKRMDVRRYGKRYGVRPRMRFRY